MSCRCWTRVPRSRCGSGPGWRARPTQRLAVAYLRRGGPGDAQAAARELESVKGEAQGIGMPGFDVGAWKPAADEPKAAAGGSTTTNGALAACARVGRNWRVTLLDRSILVADSTGMLHLAVLIANPRQDISAADLVAGVAVLGTAVSGAGPGQPVLDRAAIDAYRARLADLNAEIDKLDAAAADGAAAARARGDRGWLVAQLASSAGLGGRVRAFPDDGEQARVAVGKAIRRALARIAEADAVIGEHLREAVHTGARCSYWPA